MKTDRSLRSNIGLRGAAVVYFSFALTLSFYHLQTINRPFWIDRSEFHQGVINGDFKSPYQYRILAPWLVELPSIVVERAVGVAPGKHAAMVREGFYVLQRLVAVFLLLVVFHLYLRTWFSSGLSFAGTLIVAGLQLFTYRSYFFQPDSPLNFLFLTTGAWLMARGEFKGILYPLTVVGTLTRETFGLIVPLHLAFYGRKRLRHSIGLFFVWFGVQLLLRVVFGMRPSFPDRPLMNNVYEAWWPLFLYAALWLVPLLYIGRLPLFLRRMLLLFPLPLITANVLFGKVEETRLFLELAIVLIPAVLFALTESNAQISSGYITNSPADAAAGV